MKRPQLAQAILIFILFGFVIWLQIMLDNCQDRNRSYEEMFDVNLITDLNAKITVIPGKNSLYYNLEKDTFIKDLFENHKYVLAKNDYSKLILYEFKFDICMISAIHYRQIDYIQSESWYIFGKYKNGELILLDSGSDLPAHKISIETYQMIINKCLAN